MPVLPSHASLLITRLAWPQHSIRLVVRDRLCEVLDQNCPLTLLIAPAGYGKTSLLVDWHRNHIADGIQAAYVALDSQDDPTRFWAYVVAALQKIEPTLGVQLLPLLLSDPPLQLHPLLVALLNELVTLKRPIVLVLDDYHLVTTNQIHETLEFVLEHLPVQMRLVIASRSDPPLLLARLRVSNQLAEIRAADLRFTSNEAALFLHDSMHLDLAPELVAQLEHRTEGWPAALQLAALSLQSHNDPQQFVTTFAGSRRALVDYAVEEVLGCLPDDMCMFLLRTSLLDRLSAELCGWVLGDAAETNNIPIKVMQQAALMLEQLERTGLFIVALDDIGVWYRYHHLFAEALRHELRRSYPDQIPILYRRAALWSAYHGEIELALDYALRAKHTTLAVQLAEECGEELLAQDHRFTLRRVLERLPEEIVEHSPYLSLLRGYLLYVEEQFDQGERWLACAESRAEESMLPIGDMVAALRAKTAALYWDDKTVSATAREVLDHLPEKFSFWRVQAQLALGTAHLVDGQHTAALGWFRQAHRLGQTLGNPTLQIHAEYAISQSLYCQAKVGAAIASWKRCICLSSDHGLYNQGIGQLFYIELAWSYYDRNELAEAECVMAALEALPQTEEVGRMTFFRHYTYAILLSGRGDYQAALTQLEQGLYVAQFRRHERLVRLGRALCIVIHLMTGNIVTATAVATESGWRGELTNNQPHQEQFALVQLLVAQGNASAALVLLEQIAQRYTAAESGAYDWFFLHIYVLKAIAYDAYGDRNTALQALYLALEIAVPEGLVRPLLDLGTPMMNLLRLARKTLKECHDTMLIAFIDKIIPSSNPAAQLIEPLSPREEEVLALMAQGLPNRAIADQLVVTIDTVKKHGTNIFGKLGVATRHEAVRQAHDLGLLD